LAGAPAGFGNLQGLGLRKILRGPLGAAPRRNLVSWRHNAGHPDNQAEVGTWLTAPAPEALALQRPAAHKIVARGDRTGDGVRDF
jgi:hypothetical protein